MRVRHGLPRPGRSWQPSTGLIALPLAIIAAVTVIDINIPTAVHLGPFLVAAPAITASFVSPGVTGSIGALAVAAQALIGQLHGGLMTANHLAQIAALFLISVLVTIFRYVRDRREQKLEEVRAVATMAQRVLVRPLPRRIGPLRIASMYIAAETEAQIGGDLYAAVPSPGATRLVVGDVRGRGLPAVDEAAWILGAFRGSAYRELSLPDIVAHLGNAAYWNKTRLADGDPDAEESFATALVLDIHDDGPFIGLVNCGHPRHCCYGTARSGLWKPTSPHSPSASPPHQRATTGWNRSRSSSATCCCSTPTGSSKPATKTAPSILWSIASPPATRSTQTPSYGTSTTTCSVM